MRWRNFKVFEFLDDDTRMDRRAGICGEHAISWETGKSDELDAFKSFFTDVYSILGY